MLAMNHGRPISASKSKGSFDLYLVLGLPEVMLSCRKYSSAVGVPENKARTLSHHAFISENAP